MKPRVLASSAPCAGARPDIEATMASAAQSLADKDITDVAAYLAGMR